MNSHHFAWTRLEPSWYNILTLNTEVFTEIAICWPCASCWLHCCRGIIIVHITRIPAAGCCASHVIFWFFAQTSFLGIKSIKSIPRTLIDTVDTFRRSPLTPHVLSAFTVISDETRKYFAIRVCTGYYRVGHSPLILYYELLLIV